MPVKAIGDRVLVRPEKEEEYKGSGFKFNVKEENYPTKGEVISIGADVKEVNIGDVVLFSKNASAVKVPDDKGDLIILNEKSIYAIA